MTATQTATNETVDAFFANFGEGNIPGVLDLFAEKVDFRVTGSPDVPWTGARSTKQEISEFFASFGVLTGPDHFEVTNRIVQGEDAVVIANCVFGVQATGSKFHNHYALHFGVADGKIVRYHMYEDSYAIHAAFTA
ncbi:nuclear transport factor 2 family protein [Streptomyces sp. NBC_00191]|uniref:nuclear transport factor 2 family protein n=1 Tax=Streptomyces sp. NBC_00191 TaxID=2975674 RepID=UPI00324EBFD8